MYDLIDIENFKRTYPIKYKPKLLGELTITSNKDQKILISIIEYIQYNAKYTWDILIKEMCTNIPKQLKTWRTK